MKAIRLIFFSVFTLIFLHGNSQQLEFSTYLGSKAHDWVDDICIDDEGNIYVTGPAYSDNFPLTNGKISNRHNGGASDVFIAKFSKRGDLVFSTFLGGSGYDGNSRIALDQEGNIYVSGVTNSEDFPTTENVFDKTYNGDLDIFLTKIDPSCETILYSTYLGGNNQDHHPMMVIDKNGDVYISGPTRSSDFPTTQNAYNENYNGTKNDGYYGDIFICKFDGSDEKIIYSSFIGGKDEETIFGIDVDDKGIAYITGTTSSADFPVTNRIFSGNDSEISSKLSDAFLIALDCNSPKLKFSTLIGGDGDDSGDQVCVDKNGNVYISGNTTSQNFPTTEGVISDVFNGGTNTSDGKDIFISKLDNSGRKLLFSTFLGGREGEGRSDIFITVEGNLLIGGGTSSADFPITSNAFDKTINGGDGKFAFQDAFFCLINPSGTEILYSTFIGGTGDDNVFKLKSDKEGSVYIGGLTTSVDFPTSDNAFDKTYNGERDAFVLRFIPAK